MDLKFTHQDSLDHKLNVMQLYIKGDDVQKLSVIQALPQLLQYDANATLTRIVPKIQQELPKSSCEFHIATSKIFRLLMEKQLPLNLLNAVVQGTESKDPVVSAAWNETLLAVIPSLPIEQVKTIVLPFALLKSQPGCPVLTRVASCKILGKISDHSKMESIDVKANILPAVQSLCQDTNPDVRAAMCAELYQVAKGLGDNLVKSSLLPSLVELSSDDNMIVRAAAVASVVLVIPFLTKQTKTETIVPLIKRLFQKTSDRGDITYQTIAKEFGKLLDALQTDIDTNDCIWFLQFYKTLAAKGRSLIPGKDNADATQAALCREQCAFNLPAVTFFTVARISGELDLWHSVFTDLSNDSFYMVRKTTAGCIHEIVRILGPNCKLIKQDVVRILRDDSEDVLQALVPQLGTTLELFCVNGVLSREVANQTSLELARALLKCHTELAKGYNWRIKTFFLQQLETLPNVMTSDFIHQHFSPVILSCVVETRGRPVRSQACRTLLVYLRYNLKEVHRKWIRDSLINNLCYAKSCYTRNIFVLLCHHAFQIFSYNYFKKHFFEPVLSLAEDKVSNVRYALVGLLPYLYRMMVMPEDRKLQSTLENVFSKMELTEKDRDVKDFLKLKMKEMKAVGAGVKQDTMQEEKRRQEEEMKIMQGKSVGSQMPRLGMNTLGSQSNARSTPASRTSSATTTTTSSSAAMRAINAQPQRPIRPAGSSLSHTPRPVGSAASANAMAISSDMSFLEQHFYIDAGVNLPQEANVNVIPSIDVEKLSAEMERTLDLIDYDGNNNASKRRNIGASTSTKPDLTVPNVSVKTADIETMTEKEPTTLETTTSNITDDAKVNLRRRTKKTTCKSAGKSSNPKRFSAPPIDHSFNYNKRKIQSRRSLHLGADASSRIPCRLKKSKSNADIAEEETITHQSQSFTANLRPSTSNVRAREHNVKPKSIKSHNSQAESSKNIAPANRFKGITRPKSAIIVGSIKSVHKNGNELESVSSPSTPRSGLKKPRPKSVSLGNCSRAIPVLKTNSAQEKGTVCNLVNSNNNNNSGSVVKICSVKESDVKPSGLPVFKRRAERR